MRLPPVDCPCGMIKGVEQLFNHRVRIAYGRWNRNNSVQELLRPWPGPRRLHISECRFVDGITEFLTLTIDFHQPQGHFSGRTPDTEPLRPRSQHAQLYDLG